MDIPKLKKKAADFILNEDGRISKQAVVAIGGALGTFAIGSMQAKIVKAGKIYKCDPGDGTIENPKECWGHNNGANNTYEEGALHTTHQHHYNHGSHASHGSHSSGGGGGMY